MTLLAGDVIEGARDRHATFDARRHPDAALLRFLSQYQRELHGKVTKIDEDVLREETTEAFPLADHDAGITLPANRTVVEAVVTEPSTVPSPRTYPVAIIPAARRHDRNSPVAAAWQIGNTLYLRSPASVWANLAGIAIATVGIPVPLTTKRGAGGTLVLPDTAERACIEALAYFMATRGVGKSAADAPLPDPGAFAAAASQAEGAFLADVVNRLTGRTYVVRDVWEP